MPHYPYVQSALKAVRSSSDEVAVLFRMHDVGAVYFPVCVDSTHDGEDCERLLKWYFLYPTEVPSQTDQAGGLFVKLDESTPIKTLLAHGRVAFALGLQPPVLCRFIPLDPPGEMGASSLVAGLFEPFKERFEPIHQGGVNALKGLAPGLVATWDGSSTYLSKMRSAPNDKILESLANLAADESFHPPYAPFLHFTANQDGCQISKTNPLSYNCLLQCLHERLADEYLIDMVLHPNLEPWVDPLRGRVTQPVARALAEVCIDIVNPWGQTSDKRAILLARHNKPRKSPEEEKDPTAYDDYLSNVRGPLAKGQDNWNNWEIVRAALCYAMAPENDDVLLATWIGEIGEDSGSTHVLPVGVTIGPQDTWLARAPFPSECTVRADQKYQDLGFQAKAVTMRHAVRQFLGIGVADGDGIHDRAKVRLDELCDAARKRIQETLDPNELYAKWQKTFGGIEGDESKGGFFPSGNKHSVYDESRLVVTGLPIAIGGELQEEGVPESRDNTTFTPQVIQETKSSVGQTTLVVHRARFKRRDDDKLISPLVRSAIMEFSQHLNWDETLKTQLVTRLADESESGSAFLYCCAKGMSNCAHIWLPLLCLTCPTLGNGKRLTFDVDMWYGLRTLPWTSPPPSINDVLTCFKHLATVLLREHPNGRVLRADWDWNPCRNQVSYCMQFERRSGGSQSVAGSVASVLPARNDLRKELHILQELGLWVYSAATIDDSSFRILILIPAEPIP